MAAAMENHGPELQEASGSAPAEIDLESSVASTEGVRGGGPAPAPGAVRLVSHRALLLWAVTAVAVSLTITIGNLLQGPFKYTFDLFRSDDKGWIGQAQDEMASAPDAAKRRRIRSALESLLAELDLQDKFERSWRADSFRFKDTFTVVEPREFWGDYVGDLDGENRHGRGVMTWDDGGVYDGEWKFNRREGHGIERYANGQVCEGEWKNSMMEGQGKCQYADGRTYEGGFHNGNSEGEGQIRYADGSKFEGGYKGGHGEGLGKHWLADGSFEVCTYTAGKASGQGVRWSEDRRTAWLLSDGKVVHTIGLPDAEARAREMGLSEAEVGLIASPPGIHDEVPDAEARAREMGLSEAEVLYVQ